MSNLKTEIAGLLEIKKQHRRIQWPTDPDRIEAEREWLMESVELLLRAALSAARQPEGGGA